MTTNSLATRIRGHLSRAACQPVIGRAIAAVQHNRVRNRGCLIDTSSPHITPTTIARLWWGLYEAKEIRFIKQLLPRDMDVVELGASIGVATAHIARRIQPERQIICVEANPYLLELIRENVALNTPGRRVTILNQAIDYSGQGSVRLQVSETNTNSRLGSGEDGLAVETTTLSRVIEHYSLGSFALVADIEGAELGMILNDKAGLSQVQQLIIELHPAQHLGELWTPERMRDLLIASHGFNLRAERGPVYVFERPTAASSD